MTPATRIAATSAASAGVVLWLLASLLTSKREAWDGTAYWALAYPLSIGVSAYLGYRFPERPWRWALLLFAGQFLAMCLRSGEVGNLWPLGLIMFGVIALPAVVAARIAARYTPGDSRE